MIEEKNNEVLKVLVSMCGETDSFKILDSKDILAALPPSLALDKESLADCIKEIKDREMVNIKYSTVDEYCLAILPKAKIEEDSIIVSPQGGIVGKIGKNWSARKLAFISGLLGSSIGGVLVTILSVIVQIALR